jgi:tyrosine-protein kinase Etk/Wzc
MLNSEMRKFDDLRFEIEYKLTLIDKLKTEMNAKRDITSMLISLNGVYKEGNINESTIELLKLLKDKEQLLNEVTPNAPNYSYVETAIDNQVKLLNAHIKNEESSLRLRISQIDKQLGVYNSTMVGLPAQQTEFARLVRINKINEKFYSLLLEKKAEFAITKAGYDSDNIILEPAVPRFVPISPNKPLVLSGCITLGFFLSLGLIIFKYLMYNEITSLEEVSLYTDAALLGMIPKYKREIPVSQLLVDKNPKSIISEAFRSVRTNLQFIINDDAPKVLAVTSTISGEGKTFNAINLAGVIAFSGKRVAILDLDMRKPKIHLGFNVENLHGMSTILIGKDTVENCIQKSSLQGLDFITAGPIPPNPAELIISQRMEDLIETLKRVTMW